MKSLSVNLLGGVTFQVDNYPVRAMPTRTEQALLVYLIYHNRPIPRDVLTDIFYPESDPTQGRRNLRTALTRIKSKIGAVLLVNREDISCRSDIDIATDTARFEAAMADRDATVSAENLQLTLDSYQGDFMAGFFLRNAPEFEHWQLVMRERLRMVAVQGYERLIGQLEDSAEFTNALNCANRLLAIEPLMEHIHRAKMLLLARTGQPAQALQHFRVAELLFSDELGLPLSPKTVEVRDRIATLDAIPPFELPARRASFVGRAAELHQLTVLLSQADERLVTILGPGGIGKTRLAQEVAHAIKHNNPGRFLDGIYYVDLVAVDSAELFVQALAATVGIDIKSSTTPLTQLVASLAARESLFIFDNFEQLTEISDVLEAVSTLIAQAPALKLLVTSRAQLNLYEETLFDLEGLTLPSDETEEFDSSDAVTLFVERARRRKRDLIFGQADQVAVAELCRLLEGGPLGIELAAGLTRQLSPQKIVLRVRSTLDVLTTQLHNVPSRQRSLRAVFDYSWELLSAELQAGFAALSIFPAAFSETAASAITLANPSQLQALVERSLLRQDGGRFQLHVALREFALERMDEREIIAKRHAHWFKNALDQRHQTALSGDDYAWIRHELPNLMLAWEWLLSDRDLVQLRKLFMPLFKFFVMSSQWHQGIEIFGRTRAALLPGDELYDGLLAMRTAPLLMYTDGVDQAGKLLAHARKIIETAGNEQLELSMICMNQSHVALGGGNLEQARTFVETGLQLAMQAENREMIRINHGLKGLVHRSAGEFESARHHLEMGLALDREDGDQVALGISLHNLGNLMLYMKQFPAAIEYLEQAIAVFESQDSHFFVGGAAANMAVAHQALGQTAQAGQVIASALESTRKLRDRRSRVGTLISMAKILLSLDDLVEIPAILREALQLVVGAQLMSSLDELVIISAEYLNAIQQSPQALQLAAYIASNDRADESIQRRAEQIIQSHPDKTPPNIDQAAVLTLLRSALSQVK